MTDNLLIHADSHRDADMFVATGVAVADPFTYLELDGQRVIVASVLEADVIRRDSRASDVWTDDQFGGRELMAKGWTYHDAEMEVVRRVLEKGGAQGVGGSPSFPLPPPPSLLPAQPCRLPARKGPHRHPRPRPVRAAAAQQGRRSAGGDQRRPARTR